MKICVIHGSPRKGNTYKATRIFIKEIKKHGDVEFTEFFLPRDMPHFCNGCTNCFEKGEEACPHSQYVHPIVEALREAGGIILASPVYVLGKSGSMKALLDHLAYIFIPHRPMEEMFSKVGMVISTAAGGGTSNVNKNIARNLRFWGVPKIYKCGFNIFAKSWDMMREKKQRKCENTLCKKAERFFTTIKYRKNLRMSIFTKMVFLGSKKIISSYPDDNLDKIYWKEKGWI